MNRPRLFLSAVSEELRTARKDVAATVRTLGFDPISQDDFPTGYGELRRWLREQIDSCEGLIQLVGHGYGAEPAEVDSDYGRVSYTQSEFLYASAKGKKNWVIVIGEDCTRDKPIDQLDLPHEVASPDPAGYQAERRKLQQDYIARLTRKNHLRHTANNDTELENIALRLRDELAELRQRAERRMRRLTAVIIAILFGIVVLGSGGWWAYNKLSTGVQQSAMVTTEKIRAHLLQTTEETHRRELAETEAIKDWKERQRQREAADNAHAARLSRIEELAVSFAEIEGRGTATSVFQEMTRILTEQGVDEAIAYGESLVIRKKLAEGDPTNTGWQSNMSVSFERIGTVAMAQGKLEEAADAYGESLVIRKKLAEGDPTNNGWQRDLSVSYVQLGDVAVAQGKLEEAAKAYGESLAIFKKLAEGDPTNTGWQRDLAYSYWRLADLCERWNDDGEAKGYWKEAFDVLSGIEKRGLHLSPEYRKYLEILRQKAGTAPR